MEQLKKELIDAAHSYKKADQLLEDVCGEIYDPIACTVFALKEKHIDILPIESHDAAFYLNKIVSLTGILIQQYKMNPDEVRNIWFPILNA